MLRHIICGDSLAYGIRVAHQQDEGDHEVLEWIRYVQLSNALLGPTKTVSGVRRAPRLGYPACEFIDEGMTTFWRLRANMIDPPRVVAIHDSLNCEGILKVYTVPGAKGRGVALTL